MLEFSTAGLATRILAKIVDLLIMFAALGACFMVLGAMSALSGGTTAVIVIVTVFVFADFVLAPAIIETFWNGRSPGKALMGIKVVTVEGGPIAFRHAIVRGLLQLVEIPTGIGMIVALGNRRSQRLGDLLAGTFLVSLRSAGIGSGAVAFYPPPGCEAFVHALDVTRLTSNQFVLIRKFLLRVAQLDARSRYELAVRLATPVHELLTPKPPPQMGPELFLVCVASAFQIRNGGLPAPQAMSAPFGPVIAPPRYR